MTGFEFIAKAFKASYTDIAKRLELTTSTVADWASGRRPIPKDKLSLVSKLFKVDEEFFKKKELSEVEKLKIEINYLERASKRDSYHLEETIPDDEGTMIEVYRWHNPHEGDLRYKYEELAYEELSVRLSRILNYDLHLDMQFHRATNHYLVFREIADLLEQDEGKEEIEEYEDISEDEALRRKKMAKKVNALSIMLKFLNGGKLLAFGKIDAFEKELFEMLQRYGIIDTKHQHIKEIEDIFHQVDPASIHNME
jgi:transcriptional regulator with XRE-family HTH domain